MKLKLSLLAGLATLGFASSASAQTVISITGATAFRAAAHTSITNILGGPEVCEYGCVGSSLSNANHAIFKGSIGGEPYVIRTSQNAFTAEVPNALNPLATGIKIPEMNVTRSGGDGGPITPN